MSPELFEAVHSGGERLHCAERCAVDATRNILEGVTRNVVFEIAAREGIPLEERLFTLYDVAQAEEYFISRSGACITPVRQVDRFFPQAAMPGPVTQRLIEAFAADTGLDFSRFS